MVIRYKEMCRVIFCIFLCLDYKSDRISFRKLLFSYRISHKKVIELVIESHSLVIELAIARKYQRNMQIIGEDRSI